ncbi:hypothetical protein [Bacillus sp. FJAT-27251]|nr:hypothetical protein [Bacillus sp. FJAT-27251]
MLSYLSEEKITKSREGCKMIGLLSLPFLFNFITVACPECPA